METQGWYPLKCVIYPPYKDFVYGWHPTERYWIDVYRYYRLVSLYTVIGFDRGSVVRGLVYGVFGHRRGSVDSVRLIYPPLQPHLSLSLEFIVTNCMGENIYHLFVYWYPCVTFSGYVHVSGFQFKVTLWVKPQIENLRQNLQG